MSGKHEQHERLRDIYLEILSGDSTLASKLDEIDYYSVMCRGVAENKWYKFSGCNLTMFRYDYQGKDAAIMFFAIPAQSNANGKEETKHLSQKVLDLVKIIEDAFIKVDYMDFKTIKEDKYSYLVAIKSSEEEEEL